MRMPTTPFPRPAPLHPALAKAAAYRQLNEPSEAESLCLEVLETEPDHQAALGLLILALTDPPGGGTAARLREAQALVPRLRSPYRRAYYSGIIAERRAKARLAQDSPGARATAYEAFCEAMTWYDQAATLDPPDADEDDVRLRRTTCARLVRRHELGPRVEERVTWSLE